MPAPADPPPTRAKEAQIGHFYIIRHQAKAVFDELT
jgi:hypothetical protein